MNKTNNWKAKRASTSIIQVNSISWAVERNSHECQTKLCTIHW